MPANPSLELGVYQRHLSPLVTALFSAPLVILASSAASAQVVGTVGVFAERGFGDDGSACSTEQQDADNIVWGTADGLNTSCSDSIDDDNIVWGTRVTLRP
ncbi:MAG: hypothetical protein FJW27_17895 [Acidimicrobiia bacterium]|nr:hypothetical protein [Acidimicrobiia bacterium]